MTSGPAGGGVTWRRHQRLALDALAADHARATATGAPSRSWVVLPPGSGKTWVGLGVAAQSLAAGEASRVVVLAPNTAIQAQWVRAAAAFGLEAGSDRELTAAVNVLTYQSVAVFARSGQDGDGSDDGSGEDDEGGDLPDELPEEVDDEPEDPADALLARLHPNGAALVERMAQGGPLLLVLDECHHLLDLWGELLVALLSRVPRARVLGLTATPRETLSGPQAALVEELFGAVGFAASVPAVVREGDLAPFAEAAWFTRPTSAELDWLAESAQRFAELGVLLEDPDFGTRPFLEWLSEQYVTPHDTSGRPVPWSTIALAEPERADALLRLAHSGRLPVPDGARLTEEHRADPSLDDRMLLLDDWMRRCVLLSDDPRDAEVVEVVRRTLPAVGRVWTRHGVRRGRSVVDRVLARSEAKADACVEILAGTAADLGERTRALVLCDHESATATLPMTLQGVVDARAGSAWAILERLCGDPATADLAPVLVTGRSVAGAEGTMRALAAHVAERDPALGATLRLEAVPDAPLARLVGTSGAWRSRRWVGHVTDFFEIGRSRVLVGTKGLLGEGWDARRVTGVVDLTSSTTSQSVVQVRGRSLRTDPSWPEKVAVNWTVTCLAPEHPQGDADWARLVRKHTGFFGVDDAGDVVDGVAHLDPLLSPFRPPALDDVAGLNARAVVRAGDLEGVRRRWRVGEAYADVAGAAVRVRLRGERATAVVPAGEDGSPLAPVLAPRRAPEPSADALARIDHLGPRRTVVGGASGAGLGAFVGAVVALPLLLVGSAAPALVALVLAVLVGAGAGGWVALQRHRAEVTRTRLAREAHVAATVAIATAVPEPHLVAAAVADALHAVGDSPVGADGLEVARDDDGTYRCRLHGVDEPTAATFATALEEALGPLERPRYVVQRRTLSAASARALCASGAPGAPGAPDTDEHAAARDEALAGRLPADGEVWHPVPTVLGNRADRARAYARAWAHWLDGDPQPRWRGSPEGAGVLAAQHGSDPFDVATVIRRHWG
ncbi:DEAD/DEAH box helicase family protein [Nocardioides zeae]|uniref:DEAD/DEAH box helicase family protein n=1 Tax=Nocardioides imazamoxiresistens TaxID=3231893 RepID=A0ABU3Q0G1_9ACTN|nr:DEAD/DEAH box helicase family protein [Nocardioides zeae]MDT9594931.1 DEAD/DEAH box helicase family protein [Nocardioides zeae]